jgi:cytochrome bd-type quinol oxidase subunit 2
MITLLTGNYAAILSELVALVARSAVSAEFRSEVYKRAVEAYSWDHVITLYDRIFGREEGETMSTKPEQL